MRYFLLFVLLLTNSRLFSQINDDFLDGDFTNLPTWSGTNVDFIVNPSLELQLNNTIASTSYLSTAHGLFTLDNKEWKFITRQTFSPSSSNYGRVFLTADNADLTLVQNGFYIQLGEAGTTDAVRLFKMVSGVSTELLAGPAGQIANSFSAGIRVVRDNGANWSLLIDGTGGTSYTLAGTVNEPANLLGTHFGAMQVYTASNANKYFYDNIYVGDEIVDLSPPTLLSATAINANLIDVLFDEALDQVTAETSGNYDIQPFLSAATATLDGTNPALVHIIPTFNLTNGNTYTLFTNLIEDISGNASGSQSVNFTYLVAETPIAGDVVINEFMCDPTPVVGLKNAEYVEIYNRSNKILNVSGWKLGDASSFGTAQNGWLLPNDYIVLTATANIDSFSVATAVTSFPSLNNSDDAVVLYDNSGNKLDSIFYSIGWYHDTNKDDGGYSLERINPDDPCSDITDWKASNNLNGGTPGSINSVYDTTADVQTPTITQIIASAPSLIEVFFNEGMDPISLTNSTVITSPTLTIQNKFFSGDDPTTLSINFNEVLVGSQTYQIELQNIADCWMNSIDLSETFALAETAVKGDVIINEIMFDPLTGGSDWVELYNNSDKLVDLYEWQLAKISDGVISNNDIIEQHYLLEPGDYVVLTENVSHITQNYTASVLGKFIETGVPSYNNDSSTVYLLDNQIFPPNNVIDKVSYLDDWHFKLLDATKGKSLERIDPKGVSDDKNNWHTAAEAIGFATPGGENSQLTFAVSNGTFSFTSETISPDNDGMEDVLQINYEMEEAGFVGNCTIYDDRGRKIATVFQSELLASRGTFTWDGVRDDNTKASIGQYVALFEAYNIDGGAVFSKKKAFVVAGRL
ncbi:MAG: lamin tail domain-containing protein [Crocinitomicaceae bacterium]